MIYHIKDGSADSWTVLFLCMPRLCGWFFKLLRIPVWNDAPGRQYHASDVHQWIWNQWDVGCHCVCCFDHCYSCYCYWCCTRWWWLERFEARATMPLVISISLICLAVNSFLKRHQIVLFICQDSSADFLHGLRLFCLWRLEFSFRTIAFDAVSSETAAIATACGL